MEYVQFTEFRNNAKRYFERIEEGHIYIIVKKGKPVARVLPFEQGHQGWKRTVSRIRLRNTERTTTDYITEERSDG